MNIIRRDPFRDLFNMQDQLLRAFDPGRSELGASEGLSERQWAPPVDIFEDAEGITLKVEVPEVDAKDVDIRIEGNTLSLKGERKLEKSDRREGYTRVERWYGAFQRSFTLPNTVDAEHVTAETKDGLLRIYLPKKAETKPRQIKVQTGALPGERH